jgi:MFS family permease
MPRSSSPPRGTGSSERTPLLRHSSASPSRSPGVSTPAKRPSNDAYLSHIATLPFYRRPSGLWLPPAIFLLAAAGGIVMAPRQELITQLLCHEMGLDVRQGGQGSSGSAVAEMSVAEGRAEERWQTPRYTLQQQQQAPLLSSSAPASLLSSSAPASLLSSSAPASLLSSSAPAPSSLQYFASSSTTVGVPMHEHCRTIPAVQSAMAALFLRIELAMGLVAVAGTGFWGALSDRIGRVPVLRMSIFGFLVADACYILLTHVPIERVPGGTNFLIIGALIQGIFGGFATLAAANQAYVADVSPPGSKSKILSIISGVLFLGYGSGSVLGGFIAKHTGSLAMPFYVALASHGTYFLFVAFILPESLSKERMLEAKHDAEAAAKGEDRDGNPLPGVSGAKWRRNRLFVLLAMPFQPLVMLLPKRRCVEDSDTSAAPQNEAAASHISVSHVSTARSASKLDWNLTLLSLAYFIEATMIGVLTPKVSYAQFMFNWGPPQLGLLITFGSVARVLCLTAVVPLFIKLMHRPKKTISLPQDEGDEVVLDDAGNPRNAKKSSSSSSTNDERVAFAERDTAYLSSSAAAPEELHGGRADSRELWRIRAKHIRLLHDSHFDRRLALGSIAVDALCYTALAATHGQGPVPFVLFSFLVSLGGAAPSAMSSLALALLDVSFFLLLPCRPSSAPPPLSPDPQSIVC